MNHRELILSSQRKTKYAFLRLPENLQDKIISGLDSRALTLRDASALVKSHGHSLSYVAISSYYRAVRMERRHLENTRAMSASLLSIVVGKPREEAIRSLGNIVIALGLAQGSINIKDIDIAELLDAVLRMGDCGKDQ